MIDRKMSGACYKCEYRGSVPGSAHSRCNHPSIETDPINEVFGILGSVGRAVPTPTPKQSKIEVKGDPHGIRKGWFMWPFNFDPTWLVECNGFKEVVDETDGS